MSLVLITGASSGLGSAFADIAAADGSNLVLVARSREALDTLASRLRKHYGIEATVLVEDLSDPGSVQRIDEVLAARGLEVDILINNAGFGALASFATMPPEEIESMIAVNVTTLTRLTRALLPGMLARQRGRILNVASTAAFQPGPLMAVYYATKAYVLSWSLALHNEVRGTGVNATCLCPGPTRTGFQQRAGMADSPLFKRFHTMDARTVALRGYNALMQGDAIVVPGILNKLGTIAVRFLPQTFAARLARMAQEIA